MNLEFSKKRRRASRSAATLIEMTVALILLTAMLGGLAQSLAIVAGQRRAIEQRRLANEEAANVVERAVALPWSEVTQQKTAEWQLSPRAKELLPNAELTIAVAEIEGPPLARRITVEITWSSRSGESAAPARLVSWKYSPSIRLP